MEEELMLDVVEEAAEERFLLPRRDMYLVPVLPVFVLLVFNVSFAAPTFILDMSRDPRPVLPVVSLTPPRLDLGVEDIDAAAADFAVPAERLVVPSLAPADLAAD